MKQDNNDKLNGNKDVDETLLGFNTGRKDGGRSLGKRKELMVEVEILSDGRTDNIRMKDIKNFKAGTF